MSFLESKIERLSGGKEVLKMPDSVNFIVITSDGRAMAGVQYRAAMYCYTLNLFGGYVDKGEGFEEALFRELKEETNLDKEDIGGVRYVYKEKYVSMGYTTERNTLALLFTKSSYPEIKDKIKCNDKSEDISIKENSCIEMARLLKLSNGLKSFLVGKEIESIYGGKYEKI